MAHTIDVVCYDANGNIGLMATLDYDEQADMAAYNLPGQTQLRIPALDIDAQTAGPQAFIDAAALLGVTIQMTQITPNPGTGTATVSLGV